MPAVVLDIEGTTTPISFVYDVLFPYAHSHVQRFLEEQWNTPEIQKCIELFADQSRTDMATGLAVEPVPAAGEASESVICQAVVSNVRSYMEADRKVTCLKTLQGLIWRDGYQQGDLQGEVFDDVAPALRRWQAANTPIYIYSSGSVEAQQLLFRHSSQGDLTTFLAGYFDTNTGPKREAASYEKIAVSLAQPPKDILFATDVLAEAEAAHRAGFEVVLMTRTGNAPLPAHPYREASSFSDLPL